MLKILGILLFELLLLPMLALAQVQDHDVVTLTANLNSCIILSVEQSNINFSFQSEDEYSNGVGNSKNDYSSPGSVISTTNWSLSCKALSDFIHEDGVNSLDLNNVGVRAKYLGELDVINYAENIPRALSKNGVDLISCNGMNSNANGKKENAFTLYWEMGTKNGDMNSSSIKTQKLKRGIYTTQIEMIVAEVF